MRPYVSSRLQLCNPLFGGEKRCGHSRCVHFPIPSSSTKILILGLEADLFVHLPQWK